MPTGDRWVRIKGSGRVYNGQCELVGVIFWPDSDADYVDIYDGLDATSGKKFARIESSTSTTWGHSFAHPIAFQNGLYVDAIDGAVETTLIFHPQEL